VRGVTTYDPPVGGSTVFAAADGAAAGVLLRALHARAVAAGELPHGVAVGVEADAGLVAALVAAGGSVVMGAHRWTGVVG